MSSQMKKHEPKAKTGDVVNASAGKNKQEIKGHTNMSIHDNIITKIPDALCRTNMGTTNVRIGSRAQEDEEEQKPRLLNFKIE